VSPVARPRLLDLFCGAGGCSAGYVAAGFDVVGVDLDPQPRYPYPFVRADALEYLREHGRGFDAIHASPPCQRYSRCAGMPGRRREDYPDLIPPVREGLGRLRVVWVIENVETAPMGGIVLCGQMFGLQVYRHRRFESSASLDAPPHTPHQHRISDGRLGRYHTLRGSPVITVAGHLFSTADGRKAMGIPWMNRGELAEAIPPAYTLHVGRQLLAHLGGRPCLP
jgi:DNA (cytosine-5)-methyltransferase 1